MTASASLNRARRETELARLAGGERLDVAVVGGGIVGVGVALDAAARGLRVGLFERHDLAHGTSRWSSKLIHGGLRYLAQAQFGVAWESAREREILMRTTAPHLVAPAPFVIPYDARLNRRRAALISTGTRLGALLCRAAGTPPRDMPSPRRISSFEARRLLPALRTDGLRNALLNWDGQCEDDARLVLAIARTAASLDAMILTRCAVDHVDRGAIHVTDRLGGRSLRVVAKHVINAAGVWAGELDPQVRLRPSKGVHLLVEPERLGHPRAGVTLPVLDEPGRWVFALPTPAGEVMIGCTDTPFGGPIPDRPPVDDGDVEYLLDIVNRHLSVRLTAADVIGTFAGLRPLLDTNQGSTSDLSRRHALIVDHRTGMVTVVGGKLTTYRRMAEDAVDHLGTLGTMVAASPTAELPLVGAVPRAQLRTIPAPQRLVRRFGGEAPAVAALAAGDPTLLEPIGPGLPVLGVELLWGMEHELALDVDDLLDRRTRVGVIPAQREAAYAAAERLVTAGARA